MRKRIVKVIAMVLATVLLTGADCITAGEQTETRADRITEILENRQGKIIIEVIEAVVIDDDGNACDDFGFYVKYDSGKYEKGDRVQTAFVYNPETNYLDDILYRVDTLI